MAEICAVFLGVVFIFAIAFIFVGSMLLAIPWLDLLRDKYFDWCLRTQERWGWK